MPATKQRRGRPATFDRAAALDAVIPLFWKYGYDGTSISMLTAATGVTPPTLYSAFGSKERLYREALKSYWCGAATNEQTLPGKSETYEIVAAFLRGAAMRFTSSDRGRGCMLLVGSIQCGPDGEGAARATAAARALAMEKFEALLHAAKVKREIPESTDTRTLARFYVAVVQGIAVQAVDGANAAELETVVNTALAVWPSSP
jgi:TetR/AcrR family transcriptional regulator, copper-responsive repressor